MVICQVSEKARECAECCGAGVWVLAQGGEVCQCCLDMCSGGVRIGGEEVGDD